MIRLGLFSLLAAFLLLSCAVRADDIYSTSYYDQSNDERALLEAALKATEKQYGPYQLKMTAAAMQRNRLLRELVGGQMINCSAQITSREWERALIPIRIPIDKGVSGYRIALIDGRRQDEFSRIASLDQLRRMALGVGEQWVTRDIYEKSGLRVVPGTNHEGLFGMLMLRRADYMPRSIEEAFQEQSVQSVRYPNLAIEKSFVLYFPAPRYIFVSPKTPRLAERLRTGFEMLIANGEFDRIFFENYGPMIAQADLCKRTVFKLDNPELPPETPLQRKQLWFDPWNTERKGWACAPERGAGGFAASAH